MTKKQKKSNVGWWLLFIFLVTAFIIGGVVLLRYTNPEIFEVLKKDVNETPINNTPPPEPEPEPKSTVTTKSNVGRNVAIIFGIILFLALIIYFLSKSKSTEHMSLAKMQMKVFQEIFLDQKNGNLDFDNNQGTHYEPITYFLSDKPRNKRVVFFFCTRILPPNSDWSLAKRNIVAWDCNPKNYREGIPLRRVTPSELYTALALFKRQPARREPTDIEQKWLPFLQSFAEGQAEGIKDLGVDSVHD